MVCRIVMVAVLALRCLDEDRVVGIHIDHKHYQPTVSHHTNNFQKVGGLRTCDVVLAEALLRAPLHRFLREVDGQVSGVLVLVVHGHLANKLFVDHIPYTVTGEHKSEDKQWFCRYVNNEQAYIHTHLACWVACTVTAVMSALGRQPRGPFLSPMDLVIRRELLLKRGK